MRYSLGLMGELGLQGIQALFLIGSEEFYLGKDVVDEFKIEGGLDLSLIGFLLEVGVDIQLHSYVRLRRDAVPGGSALAGYDGGAGLHK